MDEFHIPDLTDEELEWLSTVLAALTPKRAVPLFLHQFDRFSDLDGDLTEIKKQLRKKFEYYKNNPGASIYKAIRENMALINEIKSKFMQTSNVFNDIEQIITMQEMYIGVRELYTKVLRLLKEARQMAAEVHRPVVGFEQGTEETFKNPYDIPMETGDGTEKHTET